MKKMGKAHRAFFRICATDKRAPRDGRVIEELGTYDPQVPETDARVKLKTERVDYWLGVGAQPSEKVAVLIKKYGSKGTHLDQQKAALEKLARPKGVPEVGPAVKSPKQVRQEQEAEAKKAAEAEAAKAAEGAAAAAAAGEAAAGETASAAGSEAPAAEAEAEAPAEATEG